MFIFLVLLPFSAGALEKAVVLPKGVSHPALRLGTITGFGDKFHSDGLLASVGDTYSKTFDSRTLTTVFPEARALVDSLNQFGSYKLGDQLNLGTLKIEADPKVRFEAAVFAHGFTEHFSLAVALPVVHYSVKTSVYQTEGNLNEIAAALPADLRAQVSKLPLDLVNGFHSRLASAGYAAFGERSQTFMADAQLLGFYRYHQSRFWSGVVKSTLTLPTGPKDDPDDLLDLPFFGQTAFGIHFLQDMNPMRDLVIGAYAGHTIKLPDRSVKRVPRDDQDVLPEADRKEELVRDLGDVTTAGVNARYMLSDAWEAGTGLEFGFKGPDSYSGNRGYNYSLLSRNSSSEWQKLQGSLEFSTTNWFLKNEFALPVAIAYEYSDIISGFNVERQISHELTFKGYF
ncbi:MAG TPA: hypothetical protein VFV50_17540 [Bdellovibrionales bacterium]|nr:hypothetical protein [Bdellovibrionales bacterium]